MPKSRPPYPLEFRMRMVDLVRAGRNPDDLANEFEPSAQAIRNWVKQADLDQGVRSDGLTSGEREELGQLRREIKQLKMERDILKKAAAWFARESGSIPDRDFEFVKANQAEFPVRLMCRTLGLSASGYYAWDGRTLSARARANDELLVTMRQIYADTKQSYGRPRMYAELRDEGVLVNHKRVGRLMKMDGLVGITRRRKWRTTKRDRDARPAPDLSRLSPRQRLYREAGLAVRRHGKRKRMQMPRFERNDLTAVNQRWSMDFVRDTLSNGRVFRCLNIIDEFSRECLATEVSYSLPSVRVIEVLERLRITRGLPAAIVTDNGSEFTSRAFDSWAYARGVRLDYIQPGKPVQNCFVESFNGTFRDDCLNAHWFVSLDRAKVTIESWRKEYNEERPHSSLKDLTPIEYAELARTGDADGGSVTLPAVRS